jgi:hypothetical protein
MALSETRNLSGVSIPIGETRHIEQPTKPLELTQTQINKYMNVFPNDLTPHQPVRTPVGTWYMEGIEVFFHPVSDEKLHEIKIIPDIRERTNQAIERAKNFIKRVGMLD